MKKLSEIRMGGWVKDPSDSRDFDIGLLVYLAWPLPVSYIVHPSTPIYNQHQSPSCVAWACAGAKTDEEFLQYRQNYLFDGEWLYRECKKIDGYPGPGTNIRAALSVLHDIGMRQNAPFCKKTQPDDAWRILSYYRIPNESSIDFIKQVILQCGTIVAGGPWFNEWSGRFDIFPEPCDIPASVGHAWRIIGWNENGWIVANSWGKGGWGVMGKAVMPYDIFRRFVAGKDADFWKLIDKI